MHLLLLIEGIWMGQNEGVSVDVEEGTIHEREV